MDLLLFISMRWFTSHTARSCVYLYKCSTYSAVGKMEVLFSTIPKPDIIAYSTQFLFLIIKFVPGNVFVVAIDMYGKSPIMGEWIHGIT